MQDLTSKTHPSLSRWKNPCTCLTDPRTGVIEGKCTKADRRTQYCIQSSQVAPLQHMRDTRIRARNRKIPFLHFRVDYAPFSTWTPFEHTTRKIWRSFRILP